MEVRLVQSKDWEAIEEVYELGFANHPKDWFHLIDKDAAMNVLKNMSFIIDETYLVVISEEQPWYFNKPVLVEQIILKIYRKGKGKFQSVLDFLNQEAKSRNCVAVFAGSMLAEQYKAMNSLYTKGGYQLSGNQFIKTMG